MPILPEIANLVSLERRRDIESEIEYASPPPQYDQLRGEQMPPFDEVTLLSGAVDRSWKVKALQTIAQKLNDKERKEVAIWAIAQAQAMKLKNSQEKLCGDKYLKVEYPCFDIPSVFEFGKPQERSMDDEEYDD